MARSSKHWLSGIKALWSYRRTIKYLLKRRGIKAVYNFLFIKSFVLAGGEGTANWIGRFAGPVLRLFPPLKSFLSSYPFAIEIEVSNRCNKSCIICEHTYWNEENRSLSFKDFQKIVDQFSKLKWVNLTGEGDAFLNNDYLKMLQHLKFKNISVFLVDSFDLIDEKVAEKLIRIGVDGIWISMDGATRKTYEKIKVGCNLEKALNNIKRLIKLKKKMNSPLPELCFRYIITTLNFHEMPQFVELIHSLGDRDFLGDGSKIEFAGLLAFEEIEHLFVPKVPEEIRQATLRKAKELNVEISFAHPAHRRELPPMKHCAAWAEPYIMMGGYVLPCCAVLMSNKRPFLRKYSFGNILGRPFKEIWYSKRYREFRKAVCRSKGKVPILCKGCRAYNTLDREQKYGVTENI